MSSESISLSDFNLDQPIGGGGAGKVWKASAARDLPFAARGQFLAVKLYEVDILKEPAQRARIQEEYRTGSCLSHPNLVRVYHVDVQAEKPFLIMELLEGQNLLDWRKDHEPQDDFILQFCTQILDAIEFLHSARRVHRDLKPSNLHIDLTGRLRLLDFGIIRSLRDPGVTQSGGRFVGTWRYAAPEYIDSKEYDFRSDLYSFGATLYFLLHGSEIFAAAKQTQDIIRAKTTHEISFKDNLKKNGPAWSAALDLSKMLLSPTPNDRPPSALACLDVLSSAVPNLIPFKAYFACPLSQVAPERAARAEEVGRVIRKAAELFDVSLYLPCEHTHPLGAPALSQTEVYWIDRERVASSDLLCLLADDPSHGVGIEAEIAGNAGVPIVIFKSPRAKISRMLRGTPARMVAEIEFETMEELSAKATAFFKTHRNKMMLTRQSREREYNLRLGVRIRTLRQERGFDTILLAERADLVPEVIESIETRPEQLATVTTVQLRRIAKALGVAPAELLRDQSGRDQRFEDAYRESLADLRSFARKRDLTYSVYATLKARGWDQLREAFDSSAARGDKLAALREADWLTIYEKSLHEEPGPGQMDITLSPDSEN
jgi:transcriptional regulator with XRE-family HTH domain